MDEQQMEQRIRTAMDHAAPDTLDQILASCRCPAERTCIPLPSAKPKRKKRWASLAIAAVLAVMCCGAGVLRWMNLNAVDSIITLDVNPSLSMEVSAREKVLDVTALNDDAVTILDGMDLRGTDLDVAVNAIIGSMLRTGYLSDIQNAILVSVENQDTARSAQLQQQITDAISAVFQSSPLEPAVLSQTVTEDADLSALAQQYGISLGKATLIQEVIAQDATLTFADLAPLSVNEIALITQSRQLESQTVTQTGAASDKSCIGQDAACTAALSHAGVARSDVYELEAELDSEDGIMVYEIEFETAAGEYEYDVNAHTGEIVKYKNAQRNGWGGASGNGNASSGASSGGNSSGAGNASGNSAGAGKPASGTSDIGRDAACAAAYSHAGVSAGDVSNLEVSQDWDDGVLVYEIEFDTSQCKYEYEICASDGSICKSEHEQHDDHNDHDWDDHDDWNGHHGWDD